MLDDGRYWKMREIGGYFELELEDRGEFIHDDGILVNTGRNALGLILSNLLNASKVYIPKYTCEVILEPFQKLGIQYSFYSINIQLEIADEIVLGQDEYLLYTNYFGVKDNYVKQLVELYSNRVIIDNAQALFSEPTTMCFYSPRKFVGIPDGGIAYMDKPIDISEYEQDCSFDRCSHLLKRIDLGAGAGYADFKNNSSKLKNQPIKQMSKLTRVLLNAIDFKKIRSKRRENFAILHSLLSSSNKFKLDSLESIACPMVYPYMTDDESIRQRLIDNKVFVATYWPNVSEWCECGTTEFQLARTMIPLPIDQRYTEEALIEIFKLL